MPLTRRANDNLQERFVMAYDHAQQTADLEVKLLECGARSMRVDRVHYVNPTGLAADATDFFNLKVMKDGATIMANWSTETGQEGTLTADTFVDFTLSATDANLVLDEGEELSFLMDEDGTATLPAGRLIIEGRYL